MLRTTKKDLIYCLIIFLFVITTAIGFGLFIREKFKEQKINIIYNYFTQMEMNENLMFNTAILKIIGDDGQIVDILNSDYGNNEFSRPLTLISKLEKGACVSNSNILKIYYEYRIKIVSSGQILSKSGLLELKYEVLKNGQLFFPGLDNEIYQERNMLTYYLDKSHNVSFQMRLEKLTISENDKVRYGL